MELDPTQLYVDDAAMTEVEVEEEEVEEMEEDPPHKVIFKGAMHPHPPLDFPPPPAGACTHLWICSACEQWRCDRCDALWPPCPNGWKCEVLCPLT